MEQSIVETRLSKSRDCCGRLSWVREAIKDFEKVEGLWMKIEKGKSRKQSLEILIDEIGKFLFIKKTIQTRLPELRNIISIGERIENLKKRRKELEDQVTQIEMLSMKMIEYKQNLTRLEEALGSVKVCPMCNKPM